MTSVAAKREVTASVPLWRRASLRFWVCVGILGSAAGGMRMVEAFFQVWLRKEELPLKQSLRLFDAEALGPRYLRDAAADRILPPSDDLVSNLGTREFFQTVLADGQKPAQDPTRLASVFVSYYTGQPDKVPHTPDRCYVAAGAEPLGTQTVRLRVPGVGAPGAELPVQVVQFRQWQRQSAADDGVVTVLYFFHTNGRYVTTRGEVRWAMLKDLFQRYAYYAKVEVCFTNEAGVHAGREASLAALGPLLERLMPVLLRDYIDLERFEAAGASQRAQK